MNKRLFDTNIPNDVKIVGAWSSKRKKISPFLLNSIFSLSDTSLHLLLLDISIDTLECIKSCMQGFKYLTCELWLEVEDRVGSKWTKAVMKLHNLFKKEAFYFKSFNRLKIVPLIKLKNLINSNLSSSINLKNYFRKFGLYSLFLFNSSDFDNLEALRSVLMNPLFKNKLFLIFSENLNNEILKLISEHTNILTLHDGINRCLHSRTKPHTGPYCGAGSKRVFIYSDKVYPCFGAFLNGNAIGNISKTSLEEILNSYQLPASSKLCRNCKQEQYCGQCRFMPDSAKKILCNRRMKGR